MRKVYMFPSGELGVVIPLVPQIDKCEIIDDYPVAIGMEGAVIAYLVEYGDPDTAMIIPEHVLSKLAYIGTY